MRAVVTCSCPMRFSGKWRTRRCQGACPAGIRPYPRSGARTTCRSRPKSSEFALDPGEAMVLALALARRAAGDDVEVALDEKKGRRAAETLGLPLVGTAGLLLRAKADGRIAAVAPVLEELERQ